MFGVFNTINSVEQVKEKGWKQKRNLDVEGERETERERRGWGGGGGDRVID